MHLIWNKLVNGGKIQEVRFRNVTYNDSATCRTSVGQSLINTKKP